MDEGSYEEIAINLESKDILGFEAQQKYKDQIQKSKEKTKNKDAINIYLGEINKKKCKR